MENKNEIKSCYIHIPFCKKICTYCDFCKMYYNKNQVSSYLKELENEIKTNYKNETLKTLYIGGGTPSSLDIEDLNKLKNILEIFKLEKEYEFTFECNPNDINEKFLEKLKELKVNRISIGIQSFNKEILKTLGREENSTIEKIKLAKKYFKNINIDLIYGVNNQSLEMLKEDLETIKKLDLPHISIYSLILENNTILKINNYKEIDEDLNRKMYDYIIKYLKENNYIHYEISNFSKEGYQSKHNLTYWNNEEYYGFGCGAHGFINNIRYENTRSLTKYINNEYRLNNEKMTKKTNMENEIMLGLRKINGINKIKFYKKYNIDIYNVFNIKKYIDNQTMIDDGNNIFINPKYIYVSNEILVGLLESSEQ